MAGSPRWEIEKRVLESKLRLAEQGKRAAEERLKLLLLDHQAREDLLKHEIGLLKEEISELKGGSYQDHHGYSQAYRPYPGQPVPVIKQELNLMHHHHHPPHGSYTSPSMSPDHLHPPTHSSRIKAVRVVPPEADLDWTPGSNPMFDTFNVVIKKRKRQRRELAPRKKRKKSGSSYRRGSGGTHRELILAFLETESGKSGVSVAEISNNLKIERKTVIARLGEIRKEGLVRNEGRNPKFWFKISPKDKLDDEGSEATIVPPRDARQAPTDRPFVNPGGGTVAAKREPPAPPLLEPPLTPLEEWQATGGTNKPSEASPGKQPRTYKLLPPQDPIQPPQP